jgi:TfoX/Sxy family transcriptional regulator of competence genes
MIIGNFALENPTMVYMAYWMDWTIIYRTDEEMRSMANEVGCENFTLHRDETGIQIFMHIKKRAADG